MSSSEKRVHRQSSSRKLTFPARSRERFSTGKFPFYREPKTLGFYSVDGSRKFLHDKRNLRYYCPPRTHKINLDLSAGYDKTIKRSTTAISSIEKIDGLLQWISANMTTMIQKCSTDGKNDYSLLTDFVCFRGLLTKLLCTPYESQEGWMLCATKYKGTIYLCGFDTEEDTARRRNITTRENMMTSWGYKFEVYVTSSTPGGAPNPEEPVNENEECCIIIRTRLQDHSIISGAELDCVNPLRPEEYLELKTSRRITSSRQEQNFQKFKLLKWWAQSFLAGIPRIICGFRDDDGIVGKLEEFKTANIPTVAEGKWDGAVCFNFCNQFLQFVKDCVVEDDPSVVYKFDWTPGQDVRAGKLEPDSQFQILPDWYVQKWGSILKQ